MEAEAHSSRHGDDGDDDVADDGCDDVVMRHSLLTRMMTMMKTSNAFAFHR